MGNGEGGLGLWLEARCRSQKLSLREAAELTGLSHTTIKDVISGMRPSAETLRKLAHGFGGNGKHKRSALEDQLFTLAGFKTAVGEEKPSEAMGELLDKLTRMDDRRLKLMTHFVDFLLEADKND